MVLGAVLLAACGGRVETVPACSPEFAACVKAAKVWPFASCVPDGNHLTCACPDGNPEPIRCEIPIGDK